MSTIFSKIDSIDRMWFEPFTAKPVSLIKAVSVDGTIVALGSNGKIYSTGVNSHVAYAGTSPRLERVLDGCVKLGALTNEVVKAHKEERRKAAEKADARYYAESILDNAKKAGIQLTKAQKEKLLAVSGKTDAA